MSTSKETAEQLLRHLQGVAEARIRPMMGEYLVYIDDKVAGQINEGQLFIKVTPFGERFAPELRRAAPYPGAKPAYIVPDKRLIDAAWLRGFVAGTVAELPAAKRH